MEALEFLVDLVHRHKVVPLPQVHAEKRLSFVNGNYAMQIATVQSQSWRNRVLQGRRLDWDLMYAPKSPRTGRRAVQANEQPYVVTKYARQRGVLEEAVAIAILHASELVQGMIADLGGATPAHKKILDSDRFLPPINHKLLLESNTWRRGMDPHRGWRPWWGRGAAAAQPCTGGRDLTQGSSKSHGP